MHDVADQKNNSEMAKDENGEDAIYKMSRELGSHDFGCSEV
jgi:hypothetical protein